MSGELDVHIGTMLIDQNIEDAIHRIAIHLHWWCRKRQVPSQIKYSAHEAYTLTQCHYSTLKCCAVIAIVEMDSAHTAFGELKEKINQLKGKSR